MTAQERRELAESSADTDLDATDNSPYNSISLNEKSW